MSNEEVVEPVVEEKITQDKLEEMVNGSPEERRKALSILTDEVEEKEDDLEAILSDDIEESTEELVTDKEEDTTPENTISEETTPEDVISEDKTEDEKIKELIVNYKGNEVKIPDPDGFLGRKNLEGLKTARAHQELYISDLENKSKELEAELNRLRNQTPTTVIPTATPTVPVEPTAETPTLPTRPEIPIDPTLWSEEDAQAMSEYENKRDEYIKYLSTGDTPKVKEIESKLTKYDALVAQLEEQRNEQKRATEDVKYWNNIDNFRKTHSEFNKASIPAKELHTKVNSWLDRLANVTGYGLPVGATPEQQQQYENTKIQLAQLYINGEESLKSTGVEPPQGIEEYFQLADLAAKKEEYVNAGMLGQNADLHSVWLLEQDKNGVLDNGFSEVEAKAKKAGASSVLNVMKQQYEENATTMPNNANTTKGSGIDSLSSEQVKRILSASPYELSKNPKLYELKQKILSKYEE